MHRVCGIHSFNGKSVQNYKSGGNITIDEQLFSSKTRCRYMQYVPNKPDKFDLKFCADAESKYMLNAFPCLGKDESRPADLILDKHAVLRLLQHRTKTERNVATNNFFTLLHLAKLLKLQGISIVGTINQIRKEISKDIKMK